MPSHTTRVPTREDQDMRLTKPMSNVQTLLWTAVTIVICGIVACGPKAPQKPEPAAAAAAKPKPANAIHKAIDADKKRWTSKLVNKMGGAVSVFAADNDYPSSLQELVEAKLVPPKLLSDPWGTKLRYAYPNDRASTEFDVCSAGPDGVHKTDDDICND